MGKPKKNNGKGLQPDTQVKLNMTFEEAMKKALNTTLPKKEVKKKK